MPELTNNKTAFLKLKPKNNLILLILIIIFLSLFFLITYYEKEYDYIVTKGYMTCNETCTLTTQIPTNIAYQKIKINKEEVSNKTISKEIELDEENMISYYRLIIDVEKKYTDKEIVEIYFYYNKERLIKKILKNLF